MLLRQVEWTRHSVIVLYYYCHDALFPPRIVYLPDCRTDNLVNRWQTDVEFSGVLPVDLFISAPDWSQNPCELEFFRQRGGFYCRYG